MQTKTISIGILGLGTVGTGVVRVLRDNVASIEQRLGAKLVIKRIAVRDLSKARSVDVSQDVLTTDPEKVLSDPEIQIVVELVGGIDRAASFVLRAIDNGKHVVTANKTLLAFRGNEIFQAAMLKGRDVYFEGAVCGGIPIIRALRESLASDRVQSIVGILNGTTNYILSAMDESGADFDVALKNAQDAGYAEADPSADVDGHDAAQKLSILGSLAFSSRLRIEDINVEGIRNVTAADLGAARRHGYRVKLLAIAERIDEHVAARVHPAWIREDAMLAHVRGVSNAVKLVSDALGVSMFLGQGAGGMPTGSAVVADIIDVARNILTGAAGRVHFLSLHGDALRSVTSFPSGDLSCSFFVRAEVEDRPGVLAGLAGVLGDHDVSLKSVHQDARGVGAGGVPIAIVTHVAHERSVLRALQQIDALPTTKVPTRMMRIVEV